MPEEWCLWPEDVGSNGPLQWSVTTAGDWYSVTPRGGVTPGEFCITPDNYDTSNPGTHTGHITVTVLAPEDVLGSPHGIALSLRVWGGTFSEAYLPVAMGEPEWVQHMVCEVGLDVPLCADATRGLRTQRKGGARAGP